MCGVYVGGSTSAVQRRFGPVRAAAVSLAGSLCLGFCADPELVGGVQSIAEGAEIEATALIAEA